jgi:hypothetical protein
LAFHSFISQSPAFRIFWFVSTALAYVEYAEVIFDAVDRFSGFKQDQKLDVLPRGAFVEGVVWWDVSGRKREKKPVRLPAVDCCTTLVAVPGEESILATMGGTTFLLKDAESPERPDAFSLVQPVKHDLTALPHADKKLEARDFQLDLPLLE